MKPPLIEVPVAPHIKKFIDNHFGDPVQLDDSSSHRIAIKVFLSYNIQQDMFFTHEPMRTLPNTVFLQVNRKEYQDIHIRKQNVVQIVKYFDKVFEEEMHRYIVDNAFKHNHTNGIKHKLEEFCALHNIVLFQDIQDDALIKLYYRYTRSQQVLRALHHYPKQATA